MRKPKLFTVLIMMIALSTTSCTDNQRARSFGGDEEISVPAGNKVTNITWKKGDLWYSYRPFQEGETPTTQIFVEKSSFGIMEGTVTFKESK